VCGQSLCAVRMHCSAGKYMLLQLDNPFGTARTLVGLGREWPHVDERLSTCSVMCEKRAELEECNFRIHSKTARSGHGIRPPPHCDSALDSAIAPTRSFQVATPSQVFIYRLIIGSFGGITHPFGHQVPTAYVQTSDRNAHTGSITSLGYLIEIHSI